MTELIFFYVKHLHETKAIQDKTHDGITLKRLKDNFTTKKFLQEHLYLFKVKKQSGPKRVKENDTY